MALLILAGHKFKKSWDNILQYAFVDRAQTATSGRFYALQKDLSYRLPYFDIKKYGESAPTNADRALLAKRLAKRRMQQLIDQRAPAGTPPHPDAEIEQNLRKRGIITNDMFEPERKRLFAQHYREALWDVLEP